MHPLQHSLTKSGRDVTHDFPDDVASLARAWMVEDIRKQLYRVNGNKPLRTLTFYESIVGLRTPGSEPIKLNTSPGLPWVLHKRARGKQTWIRAPEEGETVYTWDPIVRTEYDRILSSFQIGIIPDDLIMYDIAKDELRPREKAIGPPPKTRSITVDNMIVGLVYRTLFHDLERCLHLAGDGRYEFLPGLDITGRDGIVLYRRLSRFKKGIDIDVGNWDGHFTHQMFDNVTRICNRLYDHDYDHEPNALARRAVATHWCHAKVQWQDIVYRKWRGLPSGAAGTTLYNTVGHQWMSMCIYIMLCRQNQRDDLCTLMAYRKYTENGFHGDDRITTIHDDLLPFYNGKSIAELYKAMGFPATSATSKTSEVEVAKDFTDLTILKRSPVFLGKHCFDIVWKLDKDVLSDLCVYIRQTPDMNKQFSVNIFLALEGMVRHGEKEYNAFVKQLNVALSKARYPAVSISYDDMLAHDRFRVLKAFDDPDDDTFSEEASQKKYQNWLRDVIQVEYPERGYPVPH